MMRVEIYGHRDKRQPIGAIELRPDGRLHFADAARRVASLSVVDPETGLSLTPLDGERYLRAVPQLFRSGYIEARIVEDGENGDITKSDTVKNPGSRGGKGHYDEHGRWLYDRHDDTALGQWADGAPAAWRMTRRDFERHKDMPFNNRLGTLPVGKLPDTKRHIRPGGVGEAAVDRYTRVLAGQGDPELAAKIDRPFDPRRKALIAAGGPIPVVIDRMGGRIGVVDGRHTLEAYRRAGHREVPVEFNAQGGMDDRFRDWPTLHESVVREAIRRGLPVPDEVAADYPHLRPDLDKSEQPAVVRFRQRPRRGDRFTLDGMAHEVHESAPDWFEAWPADPSAPLLDGTIARWREVATSAADIVPAGPPLVAKAILAKSEGERRMVETGPVAGDGYTYGGVTFAVAAVDPATGAFTVADPRFPDAATGEGSPDDWRALMAEPGVIKHPAP